MTNSDKRVVRDFKKAVTAAKNSRDMFWRSQAPELASMLTQALYQLKAAVSEPRAGVDALLAFYERDAQIIGRCDDSDGCVGDVFNGLAVQMLVEFAGQCPDKEEIAKKLVASQADSEYGLREHLVDMVSSFLGRDEIPQLVVHIDKIIAAQQDAERSKRYLWMIESLAKQIKDGALFEQTCKRSHSTLQSWIYIEIAQVYFDSGDAKTAYDRLQKVDDGGGHYQSEYIKLYKEVCLALGKTEDADAAAWKIFRGSRSKDSLDELLAQIGQDKRAEVIEGEKQLIMADKEIKPSDAEFLLDMGLADCAQQYIIERCWQLDGEQYYSFAPLAESLEEKGLCLAAAMVYRALLEGNLAKAQSKYYSHGVRYLRRLEALSSHIKDWCGIEPHEEYMQTIKKQHSRKPAFWAKYERKSCLI